jgi:hypothetical protein
MPYILEGRTYKVQFANIAAVGAVPSSRVIAAGTGLAGGGDLTTNRVISIAAGGVGFDQLALSGVTQGTYGSGSAIPILTVDAKGRVTSATTAPLDVTGFVPTSRTITAGDGLTGGGSLANNVTLTANFSAATPSALGTASAGTAITVSRGDHVHPAVNLSDTSQTQGALPLGRGGTGDALSPVAGAVVYSTGSKFALTNPGLAGQVLVSAGTDEPQWQTIEGAGTVTSVNASGGATGLSFTGGPITVSGTLTLGGTLEVASGGTGATTAAVARTNLGATTLGGNVFTLTNPSAVTFPRFNADNTVSALDAATFRTAIGAGTSSTTGTVTSVSGTGTVSGLSLSGTVTSAGSLTLGGTLAVLPSNFASQTANTVLAAPNGAAGVPTFRAIVAADIPTLNQNTTGTASNVTGTVAIANGGTGATTAAAARTNLGATTVGGNFFTVADPSAITFTRVNADNTVSLLDAATFRTAIGAGTGAGSVTSVSGTGTVSGLTLSGTVTTSGSLTLGGTLAVTPSNFSPQTANTFLAAPNGAAGVPTFRNIVAADVPTLNQNTTGTASNVTGIVAVANGGTGASVAGTARTNLGAAASGANTDITSIALTTGTISTTPVSGTDIVNKLYADSIASGINFHQSVRLATAAALPANTYNNGTSGVGATLTGNANGALSVDGVAAVVGNRILVKNEAAGANNGVYTVTQTGSGAAVYILTRATDFDSAGTGVDQIDAGDFFLVTAGSTQSNTSWVQQTPLPITVGTTALVFTQFAAPVLYSAGTGLTLAGTVFSITNTGVTASTYGSASSVPVIAVNAQGQATSVTNTSIAIAASQITSGTVTVAQGGTGATTLTANGVLLGNGTSAVSATAVGATGQVLVGNTGGAPTWASLSGVGVTSFSAGTTGLTPSTATTGAITLAGTLNVANGGTGVTTSTGTGSVVLSNSPTLVTPALGAATATSITLTKLALTVDSPFYTGGNISSGANNLGIGTTGASIFGVFTNNAERMRVTTNGDVLINTTASLYGFASNPSLELNGAAGAVLGLKVGGVAGSYIQHSGDLTIANTTANNMRLFTNNTERMRITSAGLVGIGTAGPGFTLDVTGDIRATNYVYGNAAVISPLLLNTTLNDLGISNTTARSITFLTNGSERARIDASGNMGIGTFSPSSRLTVVSSTSSLAQFTGPEYSQIRHSDGTRTLFTQVFSNEARLFTETATPLTFGTTNTERMRIDASGNVGIGTTSLSDKLTVQGSGNFRVASGNVGVALSGSGWSYSNYFNAADNSLRWYSSTGGDRLALDSSGNFGIGTTGPISKLQVVGAAGGLIVDYLGSNYYDASVHYFRNYGATATSYILVSPTSTLFSTNAALPLTFGTNNAERVRIDASGNVGIGTSSPDSALQVLAGAVAGFRVGYNGTSVNYYDADTQVFRNIAGAEAMRITSGGNIGINVASPTTKLQVNGGVAINGATFPSSGVGMELLWDGTQSVIQSYNRNTSTYQPLRFDGSALQLFTSGTEKARLDSSGNVGIGTTSPGAKLEVASTTDGDTIRVSFPSAATGSTGGGIQFRAYTNSATLVEQGRIQTICTDGSPSYGGAMRFMTAGSGALAERMRIDQTGNMLVGTTTSYGGRLSLVPAANPTTASGANQISIGESSSNTAYRLNVGYMLVSGSYYAGSIQSIAGSAGAPLVLNADGGNVGIATAAPGTRLDVVGPDNNGAQYRTSTRTIGIGSISGVNALYGGSGTELTFHIGSERARITSGGLFGIGTTSPSTILDATQASSGYWTGSAWTGTPSAITVTNTNLGGYDPVFIGRMTDSGGTSKNAFAIGAVGTSSWTAGDNASQTADVYFAVRNNAGGITERMRITTLGNVGIGNSAPVAKLQVKGGGSITSLATWNTLANTMFELANPAVRFGVGYDASDQVLLQAFDSTNAARNIGMQVYGGNVGVGTASPATKFVVSNGGAGGVEFDTNGLIQSYNRSTSAYQFMYLDAAQILFRPSGTERMRLDGSGVLLINRSSTSGYGKLNVDGGADFTGGNVLLCRDTGNVGIGTASPSQRLDVSFEDTTTNRINPVNVAAITATSTAAAGPPYTGFGPALVFRSESYDGITYAGPRVRMAINDDSISTTAGSSLAFDVTATKGASPTQAMIIVPSGNVGIGTDAPAYRLDVRSGATATAGQFNSTATTAYNPSGYNGGAARLFMYGGNATNSFTGTQYTHGGSFEAFFGAVQNSSGLADFVFQGYNGSAYAERMRITSGGLVGIGTTAPISGAGLTIGNDGNSSATVKQSFSTSTTERAFISINAGSGEMRYSAGYSGYGGFSTFYTVGSERMRIDGSGNVGIGTSSPTGTVHVVGAGTSTSVSSPTGTQILSHAGGFDGGSYGASLNFTQQWWSGAPTNLISVGQITGLKTAGNGNFGGGLAFFVGPQGAGSATMIEAMRINSGGDLLVGAATATYSLSGRGLIEVNGSFDSLMAFKVGGTPRLYIQASTGGEAYVVAPSNALVLQTGAAVPIQFLTNNTEKMRITSAGNVGIGTSSPGTTLDLVGRFRASSFAASGYALLEYGTSATATNNWHVGSEGDGTFRWYNGNLGAGTERLRITSTGGITSADLADAVGYKGLPQNSQTAAYTLALSDMGKHISITTGGVVIPANGSVAFPIGATIVVFNNSGSSQTISITTDTLRQAGTANTGSRTLAQYGLATLVKVTSTVWVATGNVT